MVRVRVTYVGAASGDPGWQLTFNAIGSANQAYTQLDQSCGTIPEHEFTAPELFPGESADYHVCWIVSEQEAPTLVMFVDPPVLVEEALPEPVYISLAPGQSPVIPVA